MKYTFRMLLSIFMFVCLGDAIKALPARVFIDPAAAIDASVVGVNQTNGNFFACVRDASEIRIIKYNAAGEIDTSFGDSGTQTLTVSDGAVSSTNIGIADYLDFASDSEFLMVCDSGDRIVLAFTVDTTTIDGMGIVVRLTEAGILDTTFGVDGVLSIDLVNGGDTTVELSSLVTDSENRVIFAAYVLKSNLDATRTARVFRLTNSGDLDVEFNATGVKDLDSLVTKSRRGLTVGVDASDNIFVAGKFGPQFFEPWPHGAYCIKLLEDDGAVDTDFGVSGQYISGHISSVTDNRVFLSITASNIQLVFSQSTTMAVHQLDLDGSFNFAFAEDRDYGLAGVEFPGTLDVKGVARDGEGRLYVAGSITLTDGGVTTSYLARFTTDGALDSNYITATSAVALAAGVVNISATTGESVVLGEGGKMAFYNDATDALIFGFEETSPNDDNDRFVFMIGDPIDFTVPDDVTEPCILASVVPPSTYILPTAGLDQEFPIIFSANAPDIGDAHVGTDVHDNIITAIRVDSLNQFRVAKFNPQGEYVDGFGNTNCGDGYLRVITVGRYATPTISTAVVNKYLNMTAGQNSYMAFDSDNNIYIAFMVDVADGEDVVKKIVVMKLLSDTGALDLENYNSGGAVDAGLIVISPAAETTTTLEGLKIDANNKAVVLVHSHYDDGMVETKTALVYRLTSDGELDTDFGTDGEKDLSGTVADALVGLGLTTDKDGNIFVGGQRGVTDAFRLFCMKLAVDDGAAVDAFGTAGVYNSDITAKINGARKVFLLEYQYDHDGTTVDNLQIITQGVSNSVAALIMYQLDVTDGLLDTTFGGNGISIIPFSTLTSLDGAKRTQEGHALLSGVMTESSVQKGFQARVLPVKSSNSLDTTHGESSLGLSKAFATPTWTMSGKVPVDIDSGNGLALGFVEYNSETPAEFRLVIMRFLGHAEHYKRSYSVDANGNFDKYVVAHLLDDANELLAFIDFTYGIVVKLKANWAASSVATGLQNRAEALFVVAVKKYINHYISHAHLNSATSQLLVPHKFGNLKGVVLKALSSLSDIEQAAINDGLIIAIEDVISGLNNAIKIVTYKARQEQL